MIIGDFFIMCLEQKSASISPICSCSVSAQKIPIKKYPILADEHLFAQHLRGIWYSFEPLERDVGDYTKEWFDLEIVNNQYRVSLIEEYKMKVINIIEEYVKLSPIKHIGVIFRIQASHKDHIKGVIKSREFIKMLQENRVRYNCLYIIKG